MRPVDFVSPPRVTGPDALVDEARALGVTELLLDGDLPQELGWEVLSRARAKGLSIAAIEHQSRARLCATERDERTQALAEATRVVDRGSDEGVALFLVRLGGIDHKVDPASLMKLFERGEWSDSVDLGERIFRHRAAEAEAALDAARFALEGLARAAERSSIVVAFSGRIFPWELPSIEEGLELFGEFRGAPLGYWHDTAAAYCGDLLGLGEAARWLEAFGAETKGARAADACGLLEPLAPGVGEIDFTPLAKLPLAVVTAPRGTSSAELAGALALIQGL